MYVERKGYDVVEDTAPEFLMRDCGRPEKKLCGLPVC
jgi:hypothetical protein